MNRIFKDVILIPINLMLLGNRTTLTGALEIRNIFNDKVQWVFQMQLLVTSIILASITLYSFLTDFELMLY